MTAEMFAISENNLKWSILRGFGMIALFTVIRMFSLSVCFSPKFGK
jgi:hypothetical protein